MSDGLPSSSFSIHALLQPTVVVKEDSTPPELFEVQAGSSVLSHSPTWLRSDGEKRSGVESTKGPEHQQTDT